MAHDISVEGKGLLDVTSVIQVLGVPGCLDVPEMQGVCGLGTYPHD